MMKERKMTRKEIESAVKDVVEYREPYYIGTQAVSVMTGAIITKIENTIHEMGLSEKAETRVYADGEWWIVRKRHN